MTQAATAKRLARIAVQYAGGRDAPRALATLIPDLGAALIRAGKTGATARTLAYAIGCTPKQAGTLLSILEQEGFAMQWTADVWRLDLVQILAREERAAIEAAGRAASAQKDAARGAVARSEENALGAQIGGKNGER